MPTPRPTLRPVLEVVEVLPLSVRGEPGFVEVVAEAEMVMDAEVMLVVEVVEVVDVVGAVLLVGGAVVDVLGVVVDPTYSTVVGTDAAAWGVVVGV